MAPVLLVTAVPGVLLMLRALAVCFFGAGPYVGSLPVTRFVDRATWWVESGPGSVASWAALSALTAFTVVVLVRRHEGAAVPNRLRRTGLWLTAFLSLLEVSGPLSVAAGWFQLSRDPTAARSYWDGDLLTSPQLVLCLVLAVLAALLAVILHGGAPSDEDTPQAESAHTTLMPWTNDVRDTATVKDAQRIFRRPSP